MKTITKITSFLLLSLMGVSVPSCAQKKDPMKMIPVDYSYCGYRMSGEMIPGVPVKVCVSAGEGDQSKKIQRAIDYVSSLQPDKITGLRGAVLLAEGNYELEQPLRISTSGVVLRGTSRNATRLVKKGVDRGAAIYVEGINDKKIIDTLHVADNYVPAGAMSFSVKGKNLQQGQSVEIVRPSTKEWIASIGCDVFGGGLGYWGWKPGEMDVRWDRTVVSSQPDVMQFDAPITVALDEKWGGGYALTYTWNGRIADCGVENLTIVSDIPESQKFNPQAEDHCWDGVYIDNAKDCWVRQVVFRGLAGSAVVAHRGASQLTVEDCLSLAPVSEIGGMRRRTFLTMGGKCLFQRCYSENGINDFSPGYCAPGPNAFVQCDAVGSKGFSGSSSSWATGLLFDNVNIEGGGISFKNLELDKWGAGWNTANSTLYQCSASFIDCYSPTEDSKCFSIGSWAYCVGNGEWYSTNDHVNPYSLFATQLAERKVEGVDVKALCRMLERDHNGSSSPTLDKAKEMADIALQPRVTMQQWVEQATFPEELLTVDAKVKNIDDIPLPKAAKAPQAQAKELTIANGQLLLNGQYIAGNLHRTPWWNGRTRYQYMDKADYAVTRFVPDMEQRGGTDRMDSVIANIQRQNVTVWNQNYGLWYDRRRDDHERIKRQNGDVWAPFFEQAIARSGQGTAWDGLSLYDLSRLNEWYFHRVNQLAKQRPEMLVINQNYFQHNILEAGAHWVDCPWRSANNVQSLTEHGTHFLEPVPFTGDKRIFTADLFYDVTDKDRAEHYRKYLWNVLDATADNPNIYQSVSEEYTGPLHFVEFWLNTIADWEKARQKDARVILNATRDVQEAIMAKPELAKLVDIIEIEQWFYDADKLYAPGGGLNLAPRQHMRLTKLGHPTFNDVYRAVSDMRKAYPSKPVLYYSKEYDRNPWAVVFAGGSCPTLNITNESLLKALTSLKPCYDKSTSGVYYMQSGDGKQQLVYNTTSASVDVTLSAKPKAIATVNRGDGKETVMKANGNVVAIPANTIVWIK